MRWGIFWAILLGMGFLAFYFIFLAQDTDSCKQIDENITDDHLKAFTVALAFAGARLVVTNMKLIVLRIGKTEEQIGEQRTQIKEQKQGNYLNELNAGVGQLYGDKYNEAMGGVICLKEMGIKQQMDKTQTEEEQNKRTGQILDIFLKYLLKCEDVPSSSSNNPNRGNTIKSEILKTLMWRNSWWRDFYYRTRDEIGLDLSEANLEKVSLRGINLQGSCLIGTNLMGADLSRAELQRAYLMQANLEEVNLNRAKLQKTCLRGASLRKAFLRGADLRGANLQDTYLRGVCLLGVGITKEQLEGNPTLDCAIVNGKHEDLITLSESIFVAEGGNERVFELSSYTFYIGKDKRRIGNVNELITYLENVRYKEQEKIKTLEDSSLPPDKTSKEKERGQELVNVISDALYDLRRWQIEEQAEKESLERRTEKPRKR